jgi:hypothetical protein
MIPEEKQRFIHDISSRHSIPANEKILWSVHAIKKLRAEGLRKALVEESLKACELIEDYHTEGRPLPDCLVLGFISAEPVHIVVAIDTDFDRILIVTVYRPSVERWEDDWKTRKRTS